jgi:hypothetical protein
LPETAPIERQPVGGRVVKILLKSGKARQLIDQLVEQGDFPARRPVFGQQKGAHHFR